MAAQGKLCGRPCNTSDHMDSNTVASLLKLCHFAADCALVHTLITQSPLHGDRFLSNLLIDMYGHCGALDDALTTFSSIPLRNIFSWNLIIRTCVLNGRAPVALSLFERMVFENAAPDRVTFLSALSACADLKDLHEARKMEACVSKSNVTVDVVIQSAIINIYYKCGSLKDAERVFYSMQEQDSVCWNTMIAAYSQLGHSKKSFLLFEKMVVKGIKPTQATYSTLFTLCANEGFLDKGRHLHVCLKNSSLALDIAAGNALISMYGKCNSVKEAHDVFDSMRDRDLVTWSAMLSTSVNSGCGKQAIQLSYQMQMEGLIADTTVITNVLCACACELDVTTGKQLHSCVTPSSLTSDVILVTALVNMYGKCQHIAYAQYAFDSLFNRDVVAHNAVITAYSWCGLKNEAAQHFKQMPLESTLPGRVTLACVLDSCSKTEGVFTHTLFLNTGFTLDNEVATAFITMYGKHGNLKQSALMFSELQERDVVVCNAMISVCAQLKQFDKAFYYFQQLQLEGFLPTAATFVSGLSACVTQVSLTDGKRLHTVTLGASYESDIIVATALVNMYGKCGNLQLAQVVFDAFPHQSSIMWNALVAVYAQHGCNKMALDLFKVMLIKGFCIDHATVASVLSACSRTGCVDEGVQCFLSILQSYGITPSVQHYNCLIDLVSRAGRLDEGENIMNLMPTTPIGTSWTAFLGACKTHSDIERSRRLSNSMPTSMPENDSVSLLLASIIKSVNGHLESRDDV